jgi:1,4-dihydroxy-2-naphthoate octaprenyltransferase
VIYSGGPFPLSANGLGDLFVFIFFGLAAVVGTYYVQALTVTPFVWIAALPPGFLITAILVVNNLRDIDTDRRVGKKTLAVRLGPSGARWEFTLLLAGAYAVPIILVMVAFAQQKLAAAPFLILLLPWLTVIRANRIRKIISTTTDGPTMNLALAMTAKLSLTFSILFATGLAFYRFQAV